MQTIRIASICFVALAMLMPEARAQQGQISVTLRQTDKPVVPSYPGVDTDIIGIKIGMTRAQAEAIATKNGFGQPTKTESAFSGRYRDISVTSQDFISKLSFVTAAGDRLRLYFGSPATGNTVYGVERWLNFPHPLSAPLVTAVEASLFKKYGPPSAQSLNRVNHQYFWEFSKQSLEHCAPAQCGGLAPDNELYNGGMSTVAGNTLYSYDVNLAQKGMDAKSIGATSISAGPVVGIAANIYLSDSDNTKTGSLDVTIEGYQAKNNSIIDALKQLQSAAIKSYNEASKGAAIPKL